MNQIAIDDFCNFSLFLDRATENINYAERFVQTAFGARPSLPAYPFPPKSKYVGNGIVRYVADSCNMLKKVLDRLEDKLKSFYFVVEMEKAVGAFLEYICCSLRQIINTLKMVFHWFREEIGCGTSLSVAIERCRDNISSGTGIWA